MVSRIFSDIFLFRCIRTALLAATLALLPPPSARALSCGVPVVIKSLTDRIEKIAARGMRATQTELTAIDGLVATWKRHSISRDFRSVQEIQSLPAIAILMAEAEAMLDPDRQNDPERIAVAVQSIRRYDARECPTQGQGVERTGANAGGVDAKAQVSGDGSGQHVMGMPGALQRTSLLMATLVGAIVAIIAGRALYNIGFSMLYNRRSCYIHATVEFGLEVVDGAITILGRKGCRFAPVNAGARDRFDAVTPSDTVFVVVGQTRLRARVEQYRPTNLGIFFDRKLGWAEQKRLLKASTIEPHLAPKPTIGEAQREGRAQDAARA